MFNSSDERKKHIWKKNQAAKKEFKSLPLVVKKPSAVEHTAPPSTCPHLSSPPLVARRTPENGKLQTERSFKQREGKGSRFLKSKTPTTFTNLDRARII